MNQNSLGHKPSGKIYQWIGLVFLGSISFLYSRFQRDFAKIYFQIPPLKFPIFVGELFLLLGLILLCGYFIIFSRPRFNRWHAGITFYILWIFVKALCGYMAWGPLSFRNAALFYYVLFAVMGFYFFDKAFFTQRVIFLSLVVMAGLFIFCPYYILSYFRFCYLVLYVILLFKLNNVLAKWIFAGILLLKFPFFLLIQCPRAMYLAFLLCAIYICLCLISSVYKPSVKHKILILSFVVLGLLVATIKIGEKDRLKTLVSFKEFLRLYQEKQKYIQGELKNFTFRDIKPQLYSKAQVDSGDAVFDFNIDILTQDICSALFASKIQNINLQGIEKDHCHAVTSQLLHQYFEEVRAKNNQAINLSNEARLKGLKTLKESKVDAVREVQLISDEATESIMQGLVATINKEFPGELEGVKETIDGFKLSINSKICSIAHLEIARLMEPVEDPTMTASLQTAHFRLFVWQDMVEEMIAEKAFWGISFGKPQRSKRIEILRISKEEWLKDGWITPHNSFLHMIYRGGLVGFALIIAIWGVWNYMRKIFLTKRSWEGLLLTSIFLYIFFVAFFTVSFEFPYIAIPVWSLFGMALAYSQQV